MWLQGSAWTFPWMVPAQEVLYGAHLEGEDYFKSKILATIQSVAQVFHSYSTARLRRPAECCGSAADSPAERWQID